MAQRLAAAAARFDIRRAAAADRTPTGIAITVGERGSSAVSVAVGSVAS
jgi:hypothetical protein